MLTQEITDKVLKILDEEIIPAEGCTEPIAIAYVSALAAEQIGQDKVQSLEVTVSGNIIKNVKSVVVPNSGGMVGIPSAAALGALVGRSKKELLVISGLSEPQIKKAQDFAASHEIKIIHDPTVKTPLYVKVQAVSSDGHEATAEIMSTHTNVTLLEKDGKTLIEGKHTDQSNAQNALSDRSFLTIDFILKAAQEIDLSLIRPLFDKVVACNRAISQDGLENGQGMGVGQGICSEAGLSEAEKAAARAAAGSDARMNGCPLPVMTTAGSGNVGLCCSMPLFTYAEDHKNITKDELLRALFISHLTAVHIKSGMGRLSAYCGLAVAGAGVAAALTYLQGGDEKQIEGAVINELGTLSGMVCDGAKSSCALKSASAVRSAFESARLALAGRVLKDGDGLVASTAEKTIDNITEMALTGMKETDKVILGIMSS